MRQNDKKESAITIKGENMILEEQIKERISEAIKYSGETQTEIAKKNRG